MLGTTSGSGSDKLRLQKFHALNSLSQGDGEDCMLK